jgi:hypothetical protein
VIFEIGGKYRGLGFVKQLLGEKATQKAHWLMVSHNGDIKNVA